ncbi:MAG: SPOR domain-containing protein [Desulfobacter sp.]|nr:MAG: SPOR domain-containing protein [Desulfobacter sp.]
MMNRRLSVIWFIFFVVVVMFALSGCSSKDSIQVIKANAPIAENDIDAAVEYYTKASAEHPENLEIKLILKRLKEKASIVHMNNARELVSKKYFKKAIEELQMAIAFFPDNHRAVELITEAKRMKEADYHAKKGLRLVEIGDLENARTAFQKAVEIDPQNQTALNALEKFKESSENLRRYQVEWKEKRPISLKFKKTPILNVFELLARLTGVNFIFDKDMKESKVTLFMTDVKFDRFLDVLLHTNALKAKTVGPTTLLIYPDTPQKAKEYDELYVKTFYLSYMKAKDITAVLTKLLKSKDVIANEKMNAVTIKGTREKVGIAEKIIAANDRTPSEVILNVEIMEVSRTKEKDLGLSVSDTITFGVSETSSGIDYDTDFGFAPLGSIYDVSRLTSKELYLSLPTATLKLLKKDGDTKVLAKPQLRVSSSEKASILIGEKVPLRTNRRVQTDGSITYDFQYQDVGVKLQAEPIINMFDQVTMKLSVEISSLGNNVGTSDDPQYAINTRSTSTVLTVLDGDSVIIGGLIQDQDRSTLQKIPGLGEIPAVGRLFSSEISEVENKDILMAITPVIIRNQDIPKRVEKGFWTGTDKQASLNIPQEEVLKNEKQYKPIPDQDFIMAVADDVFLPNDKYFSIQVYSSKDEKDAERFSELLENQGFQVWVRPADIKGKGTYYRVFLGQYASYQQAESRRLELLENDTFEKDIHIVDRLYVYGE